VVKAIAEPATADPEQVFPRLTYLLVVLVFSPVFGREFREQGR
jgi:hypothetical protein